VTLASVREPSIVTYRQTGELSRTPDWTPLSTNATCQLEKLERNKRIGRLGCVFGYEVRSSPLRLENRVTTNNLQNVGDNGSCLCATMLSTK
jgi:hypothetical protein